MDLSNIFLAYDVRGKVGSELSELVVERIGRAFGDWLPTEGAVAVGYDMRPDSALLAEALRNGLVRAGRAVLDIGQVSTDMIYFATGHLGLAGGAMVTASHNPGDYNGIKFCQVGAQPVGIESGLLEIRNKAEQADYADVPRGSVEERDVTEDWINHVLSFIEVEKLKPFRLAVDAGNGMMGKIFAELEPYVPFDVHEMYFELDGTFPNHIANPLDPNNLIDVSAAIVREKCDAGIAFDGDGDRAVLLDEQGNPLSGTVMTALLAQYFLSKKPGATILHNAICGQAAVDAILAAGGVAVRTKVGHSYIKQEMRVHQAIFAGEHSSHFYFEDNYMADSGLIAAMIGLYILSTSGKRLSELVAPYRSAYHAINETNFEVTDKQAAISRVAKALGGEQDQLDGLTAHFDGAWVNVRASNTEPLLRLNAEAKTVKRLEQLVAIARQAIEA